MTVLAKISNALAPPVGFTEVWNDRGSGTHIDVRVMQVNPPSGYLSRICGGGWIS